jgi:hypothetical protein
MMIGPFVSTTYNLAERKIVRGGASRNLMLPFLNQNGPYRRPLGTAAHAFKPAAF